MVLDNSMSMGLTGGWNLLSHEDRLKVWRYMCYFKPVVIILSPECNGFCIVMNAHWGNTSSADVDYVRDTCYALWLFSIQVAVHQATNKRFYVLEHP